MENENTPSYFTQEIEELVREMSEEEMLNELTNLADTRSWIAIMKYNAIRLSYAQAALNGGDPNKDATGMARNQGIMLGVSDLQNMVISLVQEAKEKEKELTTNKE